MQLGDQLPDGERGDAFERLRGAATVRIPDLSWPLMAVAIDVPGHASSAPRRADMALRSGRFTAGRPGGGIRLAGDFQGPSTKAPYDAGPITSDVELKGV